MLPEDHCPFPSFPWNQLWYLWPDHTQLVLCLPWAVPHIDPWQKSGSKVPAMLLTILWAPTPSGQGQSAPTQRAELGRDARSTKSRKPSGNDPRSRVKTKGPACPLLPWKTMPWEHGAALAHDSFTKADTDSPQVRRRAACGCRNWHDAPTVLPTLKMRQSDWCSAYREVRRYWLSVVTSIW